MNVNLIKGIALENTFNNYGGTNYRFKEEKLREDIKFLLCQEKGKFYPDPDFGSNLYSYLFSPLTEETGELIKQEVYDVITSHYPQLTLDHIDVTMSSKTISISVGYMYSDSDNPQELSFELINKL